MWWFGSAVRKEDSAVTELKERVHLLERYLKVILERMVIDAEERQTAIVQARAHAEDYLILTKKLEEVLSRLASIRDPQ